VVVGFLTKPAWIKPLWIKPLWIKPFWGKPFGPRRFSPEHEAIARTQPSAGAKVTAMQLILEHGKVHAAFLQPGQHELSAVIAISPKNSAGG
jgi:hypothetical protein